MTTITQPPQHLFYRYTYTFNEIQVVTYNGITSNLTALQCHEKKTPYIKIVHMQIQLYLH